MELLVCDGMSLVICLLSCEQSAISTESVGTNRIHGKKCMISWQNF